MLKLFFSRRATVDTIEIFDYLEEQAEGLGDSFLEELAETYRKLQEFPFLFQSVRGQIRRAPLRRFRYHIFYLADEHAQQVIIAAIIHQSANPAVWPDK